MTAVTVIEAGPCPVVQVKTVDTDGYDAVQLAFDAVAERKISKPERGHLEKAGAGPHRHLVEVRGHSGLAVGETVTVEAFEPGERIKVSGDLGRQGVPGHDQAARLHARPGLARLAQRPRAGLDRRVRDAVARLQGHADVRPHGRRARHPARSRRARDRRRAEPAPRPRLRPRAGERARGDQGGLGDGRRSKAPVLGGSKAKEVSLEASVFGAEIKPHLVHETVRAEMNAARAGTRGGKSRGLVAGGRSKPWRQKGTGRARAGTTRAPQWTGGGMAFPPGQRSFEVKVNRKARRAAFRARSPTTRRRGRSPCSTAPRSRHRRPRRRCALLEGWEKERPTVVVATEDEEALVKSFRNLDARARDDSGRARRRERRLGAVAARDRGCAAARARARRRRHGAEERGGRVE